MPGASTVNEAAAKSEETSESSLQDSELEELIKTIDQESKMTDSVLNTSQDISSVNHSFTERGYKNPSLQQFSQNDHEML